LFLKQNLTKQQKTIIFKNNFTNQHFNNIIQNFKQENQNQPHCVVEQTTEKL
jgi:hypothetical protein